MTAASRKKPRRVLRGLGTDELVHQPMEAAAHLASAIKSELLCLMVAQQDLFNFAGLPFARAFGPGGLVSSITLEDIESHFNRLARTVEHSLAESCARTHVTWHMMRPRGETFSELSVVLEEGDVVVITLHEIRVSHQGLLGAARLLFDRAAAVVVPSPLAEPKGPVLAVGDGP